MLSCDNPCCFVNCKYNVLLKNLSLSLSKLMVFKIKIMYSVDEDLRIPFIILKFFFAPLFKEYDILDVVCVQADRPCSDGPPCSSSKRFVLSQGDRIAYAAYGNPPKLFSAVENETFGGRRRRSNLLLN